MYKLQIAFVNVMEFNGLELPHVLVNCIAFEMDVIIGNDAVIGFETMTELLGVVKYVNSP